MQIVEIQFAPWDQSYYFKPEDEMGQLLELQKGDEVVVKTTVGIDLGKVLEKGEFSETSKDIKDIKPIVRKVTPVDKLKYMELNKNCPEMVKYCHDLIKKHKLSMKLVDAHVSFDEQRVIFAFIADGRVDFRELVKELTRKYQKVIRLQQIGVRDEAKHTGDIGSCGRKLCCLTHLKELGNVSTDYAKFQQVAHRGAERLSGICDRLKCCLRYEQPVYEELAKSFPEMGSKLKTKAGNGVVVGQHILKGTVDLNIGKEGKREIVEVSIK